MRAGVSEASHAADGSRTDKVSITDASGPPPSTQTNLIFTHAHVSTCAQLLQSTLNLDGLSCTHASDMRSAHRRNGARDAAGAIGPYASRTVRWRAVRTITPTGLPLEAILARALQASVLLFLRRGFLVHVAHSRLHRSTQRRRQNRRFECSRRSRRGRLGSTGKSRTGPFKG